jgi:FkbM family methyltransferase
MFRHTLKKNALPMATRLFAWPGLRRLPPLLEMAGAALQSKRGGGCAATWQEIEGALNFIGTRSPVVFDVGAAVGNWTSALLSALPDTRRVVMFEPQPSCWATLEKIQSETVELEKKAASDTSGTLSFWANANPFISSVYEKAGGGPESLRISVSAIALDDFISARRIEAVDYVKIDVEGHELSVINGTRRSIERGIVKALSFEFGQADVASRTFFRDFWDCFTNIGLRLYRLGHDGRAIHIPSYTYDLESFGGVSNYVASAQKPKRSR